MITITERELLGQALESMCWAARTLNIDPDEAPNYHRSLENIRIALSAPDDLERLRKDAERMREALTFYAEGDHFTFDRDAWDTVSDEPQNYWCDEAGTATVEDGTIAKLALDAAMKGTP